MHFGSVSEGKVAMRRRSLLQSLGLAGLATLAIGQQNNAEVVGDPEGHKCEQFCFDSAETIARQNIAETGSWKESLHDWSTRTMVVTRCGLAGCEVSKETGRSDWRFRRRALSPDERCSFRDEYGRVAPLLLTIEVMAIRGFILNGRHDGWNLSTGNL